MIVDRIEYAAEYEKQLPHLADALELIRTKKDMGPERNYFRGGYVMRQAGMTKPASEAAFETHREYIDVFILAEGKETVLWNRLERMEETAPYDPEKDKLALKGEGWGLEMSPGMFCALFPSDAHAPCRHRDGEESGPYVKYVVKLEYKPQ